MFGKKYLLLELDPFEAEFYHLPKFVPYFSVDQKRLKEEGFQWEKAINAMRYLVSNEDCEEYKLYKLFARKWNLYEKLTKLIESQKFDDAEKIINQILSIDLLDPSAYLNLGFVHRSQGEYAKAEQSYKKGLELVNYQIPFLAGMAKTYEELGKLEDAIYFWNLILEKINNEEEQNSDYPLFNQAQSEAIESLIKHKIYKNNDFADAAETIYNAKQEAKSFIEFAKSDGNSQAIYEQEMPEQEETESGPLLGSLIPDENYEVLMRKQFQQNYNNIETLTSLGVKLVHYKHTKLAMKVFERVYQLSQAEGKKVPAELGMAIGRN